MTAVRLATQFDDLEQQRLAATLGMWAFLATEILFFGGMLAGYGVYRARFPETWGAASRELDLWWGTANTAVLLTSSLTMAFAVDAARGARSRRLRVFLVLTIVLGAAFLGIKVWEYLHKWHEHLVPGVRFEWPDDEGGRGPAELFFSFYFVMTGFHALHMLIGLGVLAVLIVQSRSGRFSAGDFTPIENTALYWHFVDIVWVYLFPLLYLIDRSW
jgi:cytochrome c oxidase subunit III